MVSLYMKNRIHILFLVSIIFAYCNRDNHLKDITMDENINTKLLESIKTRRILFGHQSVGMNIIEGIKTIKSKNGLKIDIKDFNNSKKAIEPGFYHCKIGKNCYPKTKIDAFKELLLNNVLGNQLDIAFFKLCYIDINNETDIPKLFNHYKETILSLEKDFPNLTIIHVTTPLTVHNSGLKSYVKNLIKGDMSNIKRNQYNSLLIKNYVKEKVFDLAKVESQYPDGSRSFFKFKGKIYYSLVKKYTNDGGHLNELGRLITAKELIKTLSMI